MKYDFSGISTGRLKGSLEGRTILDSYCRKLSCDVDSCPFNLTSIQCISGHATFVGEEFKKELERRNKMKEEFKVGEVIEVRDHSYDDWEHVKFIAKAPYDLSNGYKYIGIREKVENEEYPVGFKYAQKITKTELTIKEIAEKFSIDPKNLRIKDE